MNSKLVHLHVHSEYSILDGCGKQSDFIERAKELGYPAVCFTEHGSLRGAYSLHEMTESVNGIKPIYGIEFYLADDHKKRGLPEHELEIIRTQHESKVAQNKAIKERETALGIRKQRHMTVLAKNNQGLKNLYELSSIGWIDGFYYRPRIDLELLKQYGDGLIVLSGCLSSFTSEAILNNRFSHAMDLIEQFRERWGDDFYLEIMPNSLPEQIKVNTALSKISRVTDIPLVGTADVHYIDESDWKTHEVLLCVNTRKKLSDPDRWTFGTRDFWFQTREEMEQNFRRYHPNLTSEQVKQALDETVRIADKCSAKMNIDRFRVLTPHLRIPEEHKNDFKWLLSVCMEGWSERDIQRRAGAIAQKRNKNFDDVVDEYAERLKHELKIIKSKKADRYFLVIRDMYSWAKKQEIFCGPGRGSVGGSLVAFLIGITDVDPIEHGLIFERFLNPTRTDMPDIDCDFEDRRRSDIVQWLEKRHGSDKVTRISTITRMTGRACLRDISRVMDIPPGDVDSMAKSIASRSSGDERENKTIEDAINGFEVGREFNENYPDVLHYAKRLEGQARGLGIHAAGMAVSSSALTQWIPLETRQHDGARVTCTAFDMRGAEAQGLMKIDVLGLRTLSVISDAIRAIKKRTGKTIDLNWIDFEDRNVLDNFTKLNFAGVFQFDTTGAKKICKGVEFDCFDVIPAMTALDRPGPMDSGLTTEYVKRKADPNKIESIHPVIDEICRDTLGVIVYQEHVIRIFTEVAGFSPGEADLLRKKIGKRVGDEELGRERKRFVDGAVSNGFAEDFADDLFDKIKFFGNYGFNRSHATAYGVISYWQMWLKTYYPTEFIWALLANEPDRVRIMYLVREARRLGIEVLQPDVNESGIVFSMSENFIRAGLVDIKGVGQAAVKSIVANQPFHDFADFIQRVNLRSVHKGVIIALAKAGALSSIVPNARWLVENLDSVWKRRNTLNWSRVIDDSKNEPYYDDNEKILMASEVSALTFGRHPIEPYFDFLDQLDMQWTTTEGDAIWDYKWAWIRGIISIVKYNQVGNYHSGKEIDDNEKKRMKWGARYANINIEDASGESKRVKIHHDVFDRMRPIVDSGVGTPVVALVTVNKQWQSIRAKVLLDVSKLSQKANTRSRWTISESVLMKLDNSFDGYEHEDLTKRIRKKRKYGSPISGVGLIVSVGKKLDKNMNEMGFVTVYGYGGAYETVIFSSLWPQVEHLIKIGKLIRMKIYVQKSNSYIAEAVEAVK